jgi:hypothetical protein
MTGDTIRQIHSVTSIILVMVVIPTPVGYKLDEAITIHEN